jgi:hypothetical protein
MDYILPIHFVPRLSWWRAEPTPWGQKNWSMSAMMPNFFVMPVGSNPPKSNWHYPDPPNITALSLIYPEPLFPWDG